ncbi:hypothetical protein AN219_29785, partial [Streptomyces nanshensis]
LDYEPVTSPASALLITSDEVRSAGSESNVTSGTLEEYLSYWRAAYTRDIATAETAGRHLDMMTTQKAVDTIASHIRRASAHRAQ